MVRNILAVLAGLIVGNLAIMGLHYVGMYFYPLPKGVNMGDMNTMADYVKIAPFSALLMVMFAHVGGAFIAGLAAALLSKKMYVAYIVGGFFSIMGIWNLYLLPHPMWFNLEAILYLPAAIYGFKLITNRA